MHLIVIAVPVIKVIPEEWMSVVALVAGEVVYNARTGVRRQHGWTCIALVAYRRQATARVDVHLSGSRSWMVRYHRSRRRLLK